MEDRKVEGYFSALLTNENHLKKIRHDAMWLEFTDRVKQLTNHPKYKELNLVYSADVVGD